MKVGLGPGILVLMSEFAYYDERCSGTRCWRDITFLVVVDLKLWQPGLQRTEPGVLGEAECTLEKMRFATCQVSE